jgi:uncharacterized delta-60 repeat protein
MWVGRRHQRAFAPTVSIVVATVEKLETRIMLAGGDPDLTFGYGTGYVASNFRTGSNDALDVAQQSNGSYVVAATTAASGANKDALVINYTGKGKFNPAFGVNGQATLNFGNSRDDIATGVAVQSDDKIVVVGTTGTGLDQDIWMAKYDTLGHRDRTFAGGVGYQRLNWGGVDLVNHVLVEPTTNKIVLVGSSANLATGGGFVVVRYNSNGTPDTTFNGTGYFKSSPGMGKADFGTSIYRQTDGKYLVGGSRCTFSGSNLTSSGFYIGRLTNAGKFDSTFLGGGVTVSFGRGYEFCTAISAGPNNSVYAGGVTANGIHEFGTNLPLPLSAPNATLSDFCFLKTNSVGMLDTTFSGDGKATVDFGSTRLDGLTFMAVQNNGAVMAGGGSGIHGGNSDFATTRLTPTGGLDPLWGMGGMERWNVGGSDGYLGGRMFKGGKFMGVGHKKLGIGMNWLWGSRHLNTGVFDPF